MRHPRRLPATEYRGTRHYFLTICAFQRESRFLMQPVVDLVRLQILRTSSDCSCDVLVDCFMPDHFHALVSTNNASVDFLRFVKTAKQRTSYHYKRATGARLWQPSFFDRTLRSDESSLDVIKYIVQNPIRAGLVKRAEDYPYWGSTVYSRQQILKYIAAENGRT